MHWNLYLMSLILMVRIFCLGIRLRFLFFFLENKQLDRQEYNLWTLRITGEEITDDDWLSIRGQIFTRF